METAAQKGIFPFDAETLKRVLCETFPQRFLEMNLKAFELDRELCSNTVTKRGVHDKICLKKGVVDLER